MRRSQSPQERSKRGRGRNAVPSMTCMACGSTMDASSASCACGAQFCSFCASKFKTDASCVCPSCGASGQSFALFVSVFSFALFCVVFILLFVV